MPKGIKRCREVLLFAGNRGGKCGTSRVDSRKRTCLSTDLDFFFFSDSKFRPAAHTHSHNQGRRRKELARSCRRGGDGPTHALPPR